MLSRTVACSAWYVLLALVRCPDEPVAFFAANSLLSKVKTQWRGSGTDVRRQIYSELSATLSAILDGSAPFAQNVVKRFAAAFAAAAVSDGETAIASFLDATLGLAAAAPVDGSRARVVATALLYGLARLLVGGALDDGVGSALAGRAPAIARLLEAVALTEASSRSVRVTVASAGLGGLNSPARLVSLLGVVAPSPLAGETVETAAMLLAASADEGDAALSLAGLHGSAPGLLALPLAGALDAARSVARRTAAEAPAIVGPSGAWGADGPAPEGALGAAVAGGVGFLVDLLEAAGVMLAAAQAHGGDGAAVASSIATAASLEVKRPPLLNMARQAGHGDDARDDDSDDDDAAVDGADIYAGDAVAGNGVQDEAGAATMSSKKSAAGVGGVPPSLAHVTATVEALRAVAAALVPLSVVASTSLAPAVVALRRALVAADGQRGREAEARRTAARRLLCDNVAALHDVTSLLAALASAAPRLVAGAVHGGATSATDFAATVQRPLLDALTSAAGCPAFSVSAAAHGAWAALASGVPIAERCAALLPLGGSTSLAARVLPALLSGPLPLPDGFEGDWDVFVMRSSSPDDDEEGTDGAAITAIDFDHFRNAVCPKLLALCDAEATMPMAADGSAPPPSSLLVQLAQAAAGFIAASAVASTAAATWRPLEAAWFAARVLAPRGREMMRRRLNVAAPDAAASSSFAAPAVASRSAVDAAIDSLLRGGAAFISALSGDAARPPPVLVAAFFDMLRSFAWWITGPGAARLLAPMLALLLGPDGLRGPAPPLLPHPGARAAEHVTAAAAAVAAAAGALCALCRRAPRAVAGIAVHGDGTAGGASRMLVDAYAVAAARRPSSDEDQARMTAAQPLLNVETHCALLVAVCGVIGAEESIAVTRRRSGADAPVTSANPAIDGTRLVSELLAVCTPTLRALAGLPPSAATTLALHVEAAARRATTNAFGDALAHFTSDADGDGDEGGRATAPPLPADCATAVGLLQRAAHTPVAAPGADALGDALLQEQCDANLVDALAREVAMIAALCEGAGAVAGGGGDSGAEQAAVPQLLDAVARLVLPALLLLPRSEPVAGGAVAALAAGAAALAAPPLPLSQARIADMVRLVPPTLVLITDVWHRAGRRLAAAPAAVAAVVRAFGAAHLLDPHGDGRAAVAAYASLEPPLRGAFHTAFEAFAAPLAAAADLPVGADDTVDAATRAATFDLASALLSAWPAVVLRSHTLPRLLLRGVRVCDEYDGGAGDWGPDDGTGGAETAPIYAAISHFYTVAYLSHLAHAAAAGNAAAAAAMDRLPPTWRRQLPVLLEWQHTAVAASCDTLTRDTLRLAMYWMADSGTPRHVLRARVPALLFAVLRAMPRDAAWRGLGDAVAEEVGAEGGEGDDADVAAAAARLLQLVADAAADAGVVTAPPAADAPGAEALCGLAAFIVDWAGRLRERTRGERD